MADPNQRPHAGRSRAADAISWDDLRAFLAVAAHGSLNAAAGELGESQPTVGRRMRRLERGTGLVLFWRGPNSLVSTPAAEALAQALGPMPQAARALGEVMAAFATRQDQPLRLTSTNSIAIFLSEHMEPLRMAAAPREVVLMPTRRFVSVMQGEAELALRMRKVSPEPGLLSRKVADVAAAIYGLAGRPSLPMITLPPSRMFSEYRDLALREAELRGRGPQIDELHLRLQAIRAGVGVGILPCWIGDADPSLVRLSKRPDQFVHEEMFLIRPERSRDDPAVEALAEALAQLFRKHRRRLDGDARHLKGNVNERP